MSPYLSSCSLICMLMISMMSITVINYSPVVIVGAHDASIYFPFESIFIDFPPACFSYFSFCFADIGSHFLSLSVSCCLLLFYFWAIIDCCFHAADYNYHRNLVDGYCVVDGFGYGESGRMLDKTYRVSQNS